MEFQMAILYFEVQEIYYMMEIMETDLLERIDQEKISQSPI